MSYTPPEAGQVELFCEGPEQWVVRNRDTREVIYVGNENSARWIAYGNQTASG